MRVQIEGGMIGVRMMFEVLDAPLTLMEKKDAVALPKASGDVELKNVSFEYVSGQPVLRDVSVLLKAAR